MSAVPRALIVVDIQNDFCEGGSLAVEHGSKVATEVARHIALSGTGYDYVVATRDWHEDPGSHFAADGEEPNYESTWPAHCVAGTNGSDFHPNLSPALAAIDAEFRKGEYAAAYSGFEGSTREGEGLDLWLADRSVTAVDVVGLATDHCVRATAMDARKQGLEVRILVDLCAGVADTTTGLALDEMRAAGIELIDSSALVDQNQREDS